jgi:cyanophycinase
MTIVLIGGGWASPALYAPFLSAAGSSPIVGCVVVDEGDGAEYFDRFATALTSCAPCRPEPVLAPLGSTVAPGFLSGFDALLVCGGLTPAYAAALAPVAGEVRAWVASGAPYAGFSAGSAVASARALVGGYLMSGRAVCPADAAEDLDPVTVVDGLGLVPFAVDVHASQWGTLGRLCAAVAGGLVASGVALDEDTAVVLEGGSATVTGSGAAHVVRPAPSGVSVVSVPVGADLPLGPDGTPAPV